MEPDADARHSGQPLRIREIPADQVVEPEGIMRMRAVLARGEHRNPDADLPPLHRRDVMERYRREATGPKKTK